MVVTQAADNFGVKLRQFRCFHISDLLKLFVKFLKCRMIPLVHGIPVGGVNIPEDVARAENFPKVFELLGVGAIGQFPILPDVGHVVGLLATGGEC